MRLTEIVKIFDGLSYRTIIKIRQISFIIFLLIAFTIMWIPQKSLAEKDPYSQFLNGDISGSINGAVSLIKADIDASDRAVWALRLLDFCNYSQNISCAEPAFELFRDESLFDPADQSTKNWIAMELQNGLVANSIQHPTVREIFYKNRFEHINYFSYGDGSLSNFLNAQRALALTAREEGEAVYAREVVSRLTYLLSNVPDGRSNSADSAQILATIIEISTQIGDLYTARHFFEIADTFIIKNLIFSQPYFYRYLLSSAQLIGSFNERRSQRDAISRISHARTILRDAMFDQAFKKSERSHLQTNQIFLALKLNDFFQARELYLTHPLQEDRTEHLVEEIAQSHELHFYATGLLLKDLGLLKEFDLPKTSLSIFEKEYFWENLDSAGSVLKFSRLIGRYLHKKNILNILEADDMHQAFAVLLAQIQRDVSPTSMLSSQPSFFFQPLARYYLLEASRQKYSVNAVNLVKLTDSLNRKPTQIYGDFLASAPRKGTSDYFIAHTLFDLNSNRLSVEKSIVANIVSGFPNSSKQKDSLIKINASIQSLSERADIDWQENLGSDYTETDISDGNALLFGYEMGGYLNMYCANGIQTYYSGGYALDTIEAAADDLRQAMKSRAAFSLLWSEFPYQSSFELGKLIYNDAFTNCISENTKITVVPFGPLSDLPFSVFLNSEYKGPFKFAPWAIRHNSFTYAASIKEAFNSYFDPREVSAKNFLGVANPLFDPDAPKVRLASIDKSDQKLAFGTRAVVLEKFSELPETDEEIQAIGNFFERKTLLSRASASERNLRGTHLSDFDVLSFATHGALSGEAKGILDPSLILTQEKAKTNQGYISDATDGILTAGEISKLNLKASIVSLSACNTATTDIGGSSTNVQSLASAFRLAGVDNVLATLWSVETQAAATLNVETFRGWFSSGKTIADSLRFAQLSYLSSADESEASPAFWAANIILGAGQSIAAADQSSKPSFSLRIDETNGYISGIALGADETFLVSKNILINEGRLSPSVERKSFQKPKLDQKLVSDEVYGSAIMHESFGRNLMSSISYTENGAEEFRTAPMISEYDDLGNLLWNYQYPLKYRTQTVIYSLSSLPNGELFALLHSNLDDGSAYGTTSMIGLVLSQKGEFIKENIYYTSPDFLPLNRSLVITPDATSTYFGFILNISKYGHTGPLKGDLGEAFYCSEPEAFIFLIEYETYNVFASDKIDNFWVDSALDTGDGTYFSGARAEACRFNVILGGVPTFGFYKDMKFTILHEDPSFVPSKITDLERSDEAIRFTQIWRPQVGGTRSPEEFNKDFDGLWNLAEPTETEDSVYSFLGIGRWKDRATFKTNFLQLNNFWAEGAKIKNNKALFFGRLSSKPSVAFSEMQ
jgi:CHAT domain-containing protein